MTDQGIYGDGRSYLLPNGWEALETSTRELALDQAVAAIGGQGGDSLARSVDLVCAYYEPEGGYAGNLFMGVEPNDEMYIGASDLWAVSTLSMKVPPLTGRRLVASGPVRTNVTRQLRKIPSNRPITDLTPEILGAMWDLQDCLRSVMSTEEKISNWWVFGAKMCARKRPLLYPVRDSLVCRFLSGWKPLGGKEGQLGWFSRDIQAFGYLMSSPAVISGLAQLRSELLTTSVARELDWSDLRLLDIALWMTARGEANEQGAVNDQTDESEDLPR